MKKVTIFVLLLAVLTTVNSKVMAQKVFNFEYVTMASGQSPLANGLFFTATAFHGDNILTAVYTPIGAEVRYL